VTLPDLELRTTYIRVSLQSDPIIGAGGILPQLQRRMLREIVYLRMLLHGGHTVSIDDLPNRLQSEIDSTLTFLEAHHD
jgi:hypothetical protein